MTSTSRLPSVINSVTDIMTNGPAILEPTEPASGSGSGSEADTMPLPMLVSVSAVGILGFAILLAVVVRLFRRQRNQNEKPLTSSHSHSDLPSDTVPEVASTTIEQPRPKKTHVSRFLTFRNPNARSTPDIVVQDDCFSTPMETHDLSLYLTPEATLAGVSAPLFNYYSSVSPESASEPQPVVTYDDNTIGEFEMDSLEVSQYHTPQWDPNSSFSVVNLSPYREGPMNISPYQGSGDATLEVMPMEWANITIDNDSDSQSSDGAEPALD
eukprot:m.632071 g.632071  ORF g.632071 m.632071 type:complete len:269 (-) comp22576_c0_seq5:1969-2775(-)